ncbi:MAG TPA: GxxExxY protein [Burkholderiaceae bacterium]|nr:GxxExxY protein [Burkholderiaceae bacterium]
MVEDEIAAQVVDAAIAIHKVLGPGLLESAYVAALEIECAERGLAFAREVALDAQYHGKPLGVGYRADLIVESILLIEVKSVSALSPAHIAQTLSYLRLGNFRLGLLLNFSASLMKQGIKRVINASKSSRPLRPSRSL